MGSRISNIVLIVATSTIFGYNIESLNSTSNYLSISNNRVLSDAKVLMPTIIKTIKSTNSNDTNFSNISTPVPARSCPEDDFMYPENGIYCNWTDDSILCWPPTLIGETIRKNCPPMKGFDINKFAERKCGLDGKWLPKPGNNKQTTGWTNYLTCLPPQMRKLLEKCDIGGHCTEKLQISERTRVLEIIGLILSLFTLLVSLIIFCNFRSLKNSRTKIHKNLFTAMIIQVVIRLILYFDQAIIRSIRDQQTGFSTISYGIENTTYLCEGFYVLLEYARTAMFMWMFVEGIYLHSGVTWITGTSILSFRRFPYFIYSLSGWGIPVIMTAFWAFFTAKYHGDEQCWLNYNLTPYYWILEGPRLAVVSLNLFFLSNIIRVLVVKLRQSRSSDLEQLWKAARAAIILLPLLGITNLLYLTDPPLDKSVLEFAIWSYVSYFFSSFQGLFIAVIYCFLNGEVRLAVMKSITVYMSLRNQNWSNPRRQSGFSGGPDLEDNETINPIQKVEHHHRNKNKNRLPNPTRSSWLTFCFRKNQKVLKDSTSNNAPESVVFELSEH